MSDSSFLTQLLLPGVGGLDLKRTIDTVSPNKLTRMTNVVRNEEGAQTTRPGQTEIASTIDGEVHSLGRVNAPGNLFARIAGIGGSIYGGTTGALSLLEAGFSGNALSIVNAHPPLSNETWAYIGDSAKMRKVRRSDLLDLPIGLAPTTSANATALATQNSTSIFVGGAGGTTTDLLWVNNAGTGGAPSVIGDPVDYKEAPGSVKFTTNVGAAAGAYYNFWGALCARDLNKVALLPATDDDIIHLWVKTDQPLKVTEIRLYFVVSNGFDPTTLPGTNANLNTDAYVKSFRPSDFTTKYEVTQGTIAASTTANATAATLNTLATTDDTRGGAVEIRNQQTEASRVASSELAPGRGAWTEFGVVGIPLHRRDFSRIGNDTTVAWGNVTGVMVAAQIADTTSAVNLWFDAVYLTGGAGLDSSLVGMSPYDYRFIHYDPRTGAKSNPSPEQDTAQMLDSLRRGITITPSAYGDAAIRQQFFRRGGSLVNNWYFIGENDSDGGAFTDTASDIQALGSSTVVGGLLELDNDQPITTVGATGDTILAQPLPRIWGPINDILLGCGDPFRAGDVYWSKPLGYDSWPSANHQEVCSPSEELMNGCIFGGTGFVFSRQRLFQCYPNLQNAGTVTVLPTECAHGLIAPFALAVGIGGIYFASSDGIYVTSGGKEQNLSDDDIFGLFHGETRNGYLPVDLTASDKIRLAVHGNDLWFLYRDTGGTQRVLVYSIIFQFWRAYSFGVEVSSLNSENPTTLMQGARITGKLYQHSGSSDAGAAISANVRTGALDQGLPRQDKLYGDIVLDAKGDTTLTVTALLNNEVNPLPPQTVTLNPQRTRFYVTIPQGQLARNLSLDLSWSTSSAAGPTIYHTGPSYTPQPDTTQNRVTNWSTQGKFTDKYVKGVLLEVDTQGANKLVNIQADGVTQTSITVNANGRQALQFSFAQFQGRVLRLAPADNIPWTFFNFQWIFDNEPLSISRWETQLTDNGVPGDQTLTRAYITIRSSAPVTMTVDTYKQSGAVETHSYTIQPSPTKSMRFVPFFATRGALFKYTFTSTSAFWLYREESTVFTVPWGGDGREVKPFGDDDTDTTRGQVAPTQERP